MSIILCFRKKKPEQKLKEKEVHNLVSEVLKFDRAWMPKLRLAWWLDVHIKLNAARIKRFFISFLQQYSTGKRETLVINDLSPLKNGIFVLVLCLHQKNIGKMCQISIWLNKRITSCTAFHFFFHLNAKKKEKKTKKKEKVFHLNESFSRSSGSGFHWKQNDKVTDRGANKITFINQIVFIEWRFAFHSRLQDQYRSIKVLNVWTCLNIQ